MSVSPLGGLADWLRKFRELHERAREGSLLPGEESTYHATRDELARAMLAAQRLTLRPGETARRSLRVARALQLDLQLGESHQRTMTLDLSTGGFATLLAKPPLLGEVVGVTLRLPGGEPLICRARIIELKPLPGSTRVAARFMDLPATELRRLEHFIIDVVLAMFAD